MMERANQAMPRVRSLLGGMLAACLLLTGVAIAPSSGAADEFQLLVSSSNTRSDPALLEGNTLLGTAYIFVAPEAGASRVDFWLDNPTMAGNPRQVERNAPWDFAGGNKNGTAKPFNTKNIADGTHSVTAKITVSGGGTEVLTATFSVQNTAPQLTFSPTLVSVTALEDGPDATATSTLGTNTGTASYSLTGGAPWLTVDAPTGDAPRVLTFTASPDGLAQGTYETTVTASAPGYFPSTITVRFAVSAPSEFDLLVSANSDRSSPVALDGATEVSGRIYAFLAPEAGVSRVLFYLDDPARAGSPKTTELNAPWDFVGGNKNGTAKPFDTKTLADGEHTITAAVTLSGGGVQVLHAVFTTLNHSSLTFTPSSVNLSAETNGDAVQASTQVASTTGGAVAFTTTETTSWLTISPATGNTPADLTITANPSGLTPGTYSAQVTATAASHGSAVLVVNLTVGHTGGCFPLACSEILVSLPYDLGFDADHGKILDKNGVGTGFTYIDPPTNGTGYIADNLEVDAATGELRIRTTQGIASATANSLDNGLAVGIDAPNQVTLLETKILSVPAGTGKFEQGGLWFGNDEKNYVKVTVISRSSGPEIEFLYEKNDVQVNKTSRSVAGLAGADVTLQLSANPLTRKISAFYALNDGPMQLLNGFVVEGAMFSFDAAGIDPTIGTRSFGGIFATNRNSTTPLTYRFDRFRVEEDPGVTKPLPGALFDRVSFAVPNPTAMAWGPDGRLYVTELLGKIHAFTLDANKQVVSDQVITTLGSRLTLGITIDPESTPSNVILWVAHSSPSLNNGAVNSSAVTQLSGTNFATRVDAITGLPRAIANHAINSLHFGPDGRLYMAMGGNTGAGSANTGNSEFGDRAEQPLSAALVVADVKAAGFDGTCANTTDIYGPAPCDVVPFSTGLRNMYDFAFHRNGEIYGPDNGLGVTGTYPPTPTPPCDGFGDPASYTQGGDNPGPQPDILLRLQEGKYYGHPNPTRDECVFKDGSYQSAPPLPNYVAPMHVLGTNKSSNGIIEYHSPSTCGTLDGDLLITNYSVGDDITRIKLSADGTSVVSTGTLAGGFTDPLPIIQSPDGTIFVGELGGQKVTALIPRDLGCWTDKASMPNSVLDVGGAELNGKLYVVAGKTSSTGHRTNVLVYDPATDSWSTSVPNLPGPGVENPAVTAYNGKLYAFGGSTAPFAGAVTNAAVYDPSTNAWTALPPMATGRGGPTAKAVGNLIYVAGGMGGDGASLASVEVFNPATNTWSEAPAMTTRRDNPGSGVAGGKLYVFGGRTRNADGTSPNGTLNTVEMFDPATNTWVAKASMPTGRRTFVVGTLNGRFQVMGGEVTANNLPFAQNEEYDPATDTWRPLADMKSPRHGAAAGTIDGTVYVVGGGIVGGFSVSALNEAFTFENPAP